MMESDKERETVDRKSRTTDLLFIMLILLLALGARALPTPRTIDDAFITFRYSRNLVEGLGFVYNPGVQTLGTTTPLFTLLMSLISAITGGQDFPWYALTISALADAATAVLLYLIARRLTGSRVAGLALGVLWAVSPASVTFAVGGMETSVNILWFVAATWCFLDRRPLWLGVFVGLGFLTRIDSVIWSGLLLLAQLIDHWRSTPDQPPLRRLPWRTWLAGLLVVLPWLIFALFYFGSPVPNSLSAKSVSYVLPPASALVAFFRAYIVPFSEYQTVGSIGVMLLLPVYSLLLLAGLNYIRKNEPRLLPFVIYPWVYLVVFAVMNPLVFRWYIAPPLPALMLTLLAGVWAIAESVLSAPSSPTPFSHSGKKGREASVKSPRHLWARGFRGEGNRARFSADLAVGLVGIFWLVTSLGGWVMQPDHGPQRPAPEMAWHEIELNYERIATQLRETYGVTPQTRVASADIGAVGYFSRATIIDTVGLVTPELSVYYPVDPALVVDGQNYAIPPRLILDTDPAFLVTMEAFVRLGLNQEPAFRSLFALREEIPMAYYGTGMHLYERLTDD